MTKNNGSLSPPFCAVQTRKSCPWQVPWNNFFVFSSPSLFSWTVGELSLVQLFVRVLVTSLMMKASLVKVIAQSSRPHSRGPWYPSNTNTDTYIAELINPHWNKEVDEKIPADSQLLHENDIRTIIAIHHAELVRPPLTSLSKVKPSYLK